MIMTASARNQWMNPNVKKLLSLFLVLTATLLGLFLLLALGYWLFFRLAPMSEITDRVDLESPDHRYVATAYHVLGSATVENSTIVVIHAKGQSWDDRTNQPVLIADNLKPFHLSWDQNRLLVVQCSLDYRYSQKWSWNDVTVQYVEKIK